MTKFQNNLWVDRLCSDWPIRHILSMIQIQKKNTTKNTVYHHIQGIQTIHTFHSSHLVVSSFIHKAPEIWYRIPQNIKSFNRKLQIYLLNHSWMHINCLYRIYSGFKVIEAGIFFTETSDYFSEILWSSCRPCSQILHFRVSYVEGFGLFIICDTISGTPDFTPYGDLMIQGMHDDHRIS